MSGGSFDYAYLKLQIFAEELEERMVEDAKTGVWSKDTQICLQDVVAEAKHLSRIMKVVEWMYSSDMGEDDLHKALAKGRDAK